MGSRDKTEPKSVLSAPPFKKEEGQTGSPPSLKDKLIDQKPVDLTLSTDEMNQDIKSLSDLTEDFEKIKQAVDRSEIAKSITAIVQETICAIVLEGGIEGAKSGLPFIFNISEENQELMHVTEYLKIATDAIEFGTGLVSILYKATILKTAQEELEKLDRRNPPLEPDQRARLEKMIKMVKYEGSLLNSQILEQGIRNVKILLSGLALAIDNPAAQELIAKAVGYGGQAVLFGYFFYEAHHHLKAHREWSEEFDAWMKEQTPVIDRMKIDEINEILESKRPALHDHLLNLEVEENSVVAFQASLMNKLGTPIKSEITAALREECLKRERIEKDEISPEKKKDILKPIEAKIHQLETEALRNWFQNQHTDNINKLKAQVKQQSDQILAKIGKRREQERTQIGNLKEKITQGEIDIASIHKRVIEIKRPALHKHLNELIVAGKSDDSLQTNLMNQFGISREIVLALKKQYFNIKNDTTLSPEQKKKELELIEAEIHQLETESLKNWIDKQSQDDVLSTYVDYHSVLDPTLKNSIAQMVSKKHKVEESFLKMKKIFTGTRFTAATIIAGIALALTIIALVSNPIGAAALVITLLTVASALLTAGLYAASYHQAYGQKPGLTAAALKGSYIRLYYYYARRWLASRKERNMKIKRDALSKTVNALSQVSQLSSSVKRPGEIPEESGKRLKALEQAESDLRKWKAKSEEWSEKVEALEKELNEIAWKDFAKQADLKVAEDKEAFDTLETLNHLLTHCDFEMLSQETKQLLEKNLGIPVKALETEIKKNPSAVKEMVREFFNLNEEAFVKFVGQQGI